MKYLILICCIIICSLFSILYAGGGKACPFCSGATYTLQEGILLQETGTQTSPTLYTKKWFFSSVYAPDIPAKGISYLRYGLTNRLELGIGYTWGNDRILGSANYILSKETGFRPALIIGFGSASPLTGKTDTSIYFTINKDMQSIIKTRLRTYFGLFRQIDDKEIVFMAGLIKPLSNYLVSSLQYFGEDELHLALYARIRSVTVGLMVLHLLDTNDPGIYFGFGF